ncbi:MAG: OmpA family protein [Deltaproteobacteria bacterium]|nr:OmpA family protein [Deltaproteobacteria bacterium]
MCKSGIFIITLFLLLLPFSVPVLAAADPADDPGSKDHPLFTRMLNFYIDSYETKQFGGHQFMDKQGKPLPIEGRFYKISYCIKRGKEPPSEIQIIRNHTNSIQKIGGVLLLVNDKNAYCTIKKGGMETWVQIHPWNQGDCYTLTIVEKQEMAQDVIAEAKQMAQEITNTGRVAVYGIYFDTDKADLKPESTPALEQIAKLLKENASLKLHVVGHTDSTGNFSHNMKLSQARAQSVVKELTGKYGIAAERLTGHGVGPLSPIESNRPKEGRAKNRRVELVEQ